MLLRLPEDTFFFEDPLLARWDEKNCVWRQDGFMDTNFVEGMYGFTRNLLLVNTNDLLHYQVKDSKLPNTSPNSYTVNIENISDLSKKSKTTTDSAFSCIPLC